MTKWTLQVAKNRLSETERQASDEDPHVIALRGDDTVLVVAADECARLARKPRGPLVDFFRMSPLVTVALDLTRSRDTGRTVVL